jgi:ribosomal protein L11 methyltransferase
MFVWRRRASARWLAANKELLGDIAGDRLAIVQAPNRKMALVEIAGTNRRELEKIRTRFGGGIEKLPRDWLGRVRQQRAKPVKIGKQLTICGSGPRSSTRLIIPASAAFGTGEHVTTAMSLRLLEQMTRSLPNGWSMLDLGTGSGILALAARVFGAKRAVAIDSDPLAISVAKANARLNKISGIEFRVDDARKFSGAARFDVVCANLYSELLIKILPKLKRNKKLILSGILRDQETSVQRALRRNGLRIITIRRRGKWIALFCAGNSATQTRAIPRLQSHAENI